MYFCCRCLGLEVAQQSDVLCVSAILASKWCPSAGLYDLLMVSWSRSGGIASRCTMYCRCLVLSCCRAAQARRFTNCCMCLSGILVSDSSPSTKMSDLLPVSWSRQDSLALICNLLTVFWFRSGAPALTCTIYFLWCQHEDEQFRVGVLVCCRYLLTVFLFRSGASALRCMICCRFVSNWYPQHEDVRFLACVLVYCRCLGLEVGAEARFVGAMPQHSDV